MDNDEATNHINSFDERHFITKCIILHMFAGSFAIIL
jgi:hypothetical protein